MDFDLIWTLLPRYLHATQLTVGLTLEALFFGLVGGLVMALMKMSKSKLMSGIASVYISIIRGTPLLLQIIFVYYSLPAVGITLGPFEAGVFALSINEIAYMAETFRSGIQAIDKGQTEAAKTLGYSKFTTMLLIILPQAVKIIIPTIGNMSVSMIKDTSLVSTISIAELLRSAQTSYATTFKPVETYLLAGLIYYALSCLMSFVFKKTEKRMSVVN